MTGQPELGKSCGTCTVCCLGLNIPEFDKPPGVLCQHCTGTGCGIYETRYRTCEGFLCGWLVVKQMSDAWRPDRSGVLILTMEAHEIPEEYRAQTNGMQLIILGGEKAILRPGFAEYVITLVSRNVAVYLSADSPKTLINEFLRKLVADKNKEGVTQMLLHIYRQHVELRRMNHWDPELPWVHLP